MTKIKAVLLDFDGTLRNTQDLIYASIQHALKARTGKNFTREDMEPYIHHHREVYRGLVGEAGLEEFDVIYTDKIMKGLPDTQLFEGADETLNALYGAGYRIALVTSARVLKPYLEAKGIHEHFEVLVGANDVEHLKPHPEPVLTALKKLDIGANEAVMVGDMTADMAAAKDAGVPYRIGITHGIGTPEQLRQAGATHLINHLTELPSLVERLQDEDE